MFGRKRFRVARPVIKKEDLKKAVVKANDRLKSENDRIQDSVSEAKINLKSIQSEIKQAEKDLKNTTSTIDSRISECTAIESQLLSLKSDLSSLTNKFKKELDIEESLRSSVDDLTKKESKLIKAVALLDSKKEDTRSINVDLKSAKQDYDQIKKDLLQIRSDAEEAKKKISALRINKELLQDEYSQSSEKLGLLKAKADSEIKEMDSMLRDKQAYYQSETKRIDKIIADHIEELADNTALVNNKMKEYNAIASKVIMAENKIAQAEIKSKQVLDNQEIQINKVKEGFQSWKVAQLDQVAKLKLKGKIENIDKAGLKDILDV